MIDLFVKNSNKVSKHRKQNSFFFCLFWSSTEWQPPNSGDFPCDLYRQKWLNCKRNSFETRNKRVRANSLPPVLSLLLQSNKNFYSTIYQFWVRKKHRECIKGSRIQSSDKFFLFVFIAVVIVVVVVVVFFVVVSIIRGLKIGSPNWKNSWTRCGKCVTKKKKKQLIYFPFKHNDIRNVKVAFVRMNSMSRWMKMKWNVSQKV